ncbi:hypothetical protein KAW48_07355 [candidate division WOR-3 bacterium]|nr:hypothetical protein [candidate division WOR-3 bacterium]
MKTFRKLLCYSICILLLLLVLAPVNLKGAIYTVINTNDTGLGSLRDAINSANSNPGYDTIDFYITPSGPYTIFPQSQLPPLIDPAGVLIDGLSQPPGGIVGSNPPATLILLIEIRGIGAGPARGIWIMSDNNRIQGLIINDFEKDGISIEAGPMQDASYNQIYWNIIGMDPPGVGPIGNGRITDSLWAGVRIYNVPAEITSIAYHNEITENLISANYAEGVAVIGPRLPGDVGFTDVFRNYIGTDINGMADQGNIHEGVCLCEGTHGNVVDDNLISGNDYDGVGIQGFNNEGMGPPIQTRWNLVMNNIIGLDINLAPLPNNFHGVAVGEYGPSQWGCADMNQIGPYNIIAHNGGDGVAVWEDFIDNINADENLITLNSIYDNNGLGIDLQNNSVTFNDPADPDSGPNQELNFPVIDSAYYSATFTTIAGTIDIDTDPTQAIVEVFKAIPDPTGYGEGAIYLGSTSPVASGDWSIVVTGVNVGDTVTATTSDMYYNTSEFCLNVPIGVSGVEERDISEPFFSVYSNLITAKSPIDLLLSRSGLVDISLYDVSGRLVYHLGPVRWDEGNHSVFFNLSRAGIYFLELKLDRHLIGRTKLVIVK